MSRHRVSRKGITPIISIIILLLITVALAGAAWTYLQGFLMGQITYTFIVPAGGAFCQSESGENVITVLIQNTGYQTSLSNNDLILKDVGGLETTVSEASTRRTTFTISPAGSTTLKLTPTEGGGWDSGIHTVNLGTASTVQRPVVTCP